MTGRRPVLCCPSNPSEERGAAREMIITAGRRSISDQKGLPTLLERKPSDVENVALWDPCFRALLRAGFACKSGPTHFRREPGLSQALLAPGAPPELARQGQPPQGFPPMRSLWKCHQHSLTFWNRPRASSSARPWLQPSPRPRLREVPGKRGVPSPFPGQERGNTPRPEGPAVILTWR